MLERGIRETNEATYVLGYWVGGQRFRLPTGKSGWYVVTWSDSVPIVGYWVVEGKFYRAIIRWIESKTFDVEILREAADLNPKRKKITLDAISGWESENQLPVLKQIAPCDSQFQLAPG